MRVGLATIQHGRRLHLARQALAVSRLPTLERYVIVSMDPEPPCVPGAEILHRPASHPHALPLAAARNAAIDELSDMDLVVMLDVDCIPDPGILDGYRNAIKTIRSCSALLTGPVAYLDALAPSQLELTHEQRHRARTNIKRERPDCGVSRQQRFELFWSLSYAVCPAAHHSIGGFDERYVGYGAEDTDYAFRARERGGQLWDVAVAWAYHQPHPPATADPRTVSAITANVNRFHEAWGIWPMPGWVAQALERGAVRQELDGTLTTTTEAEPERARSSGGRSREQRAGNANA